MKMVFRLHAVRRMFERGISREEVAAIVARGIAIATYPRDAPYPSKLLLGWREKGPLHAVVAYNAADDEHVVITVYEPDPALWDETFTRKRP